MDSNGTTTIKGLIIPVDWDDRGFVTAAAIMTDFEEEYLINEDSWGDELFAFLRQRVKVRGLVRKNEIGKNVITVKNYEVLEESFQGWKGWNEGNGPVFEVTTNGKKEEK